MKISELKLNSKIYDIDYRKVRIYKYLCVHPSWPRYHILMDECENPFKIFDEKLQNILDQGFESFESTRLEVANRLEQDIISIRSSVSS